MEKHQKNGGEEATATANKVKLMCSYGGRIQPRPNDHRLSYIGGDTKILTVNRDVKLPDIVTRLTTLFNFNSNNAASVCIKYQLPGEDLDALVSLINDDDVEHMMFEYDRMHEILAHQNKPARLRLFVFSSNRAENSRAVNPDFLFGFDKEYKYDDHHHHFNNRTPPSAAAPVEAMPLDLLQISGIIVQRPEYTGSGHDVAQPVQQQSQPPRQTYVGNGFQPGVYRVPVMASGFHQVMLNSVEQPVYNFVQATPSVSEQKVMVSRENGLLSIK